MKKTLMCGGLSIALFVGSSSANENDYTYTADDSILNACGVDVISPLMYDLIMRDDEVFKTMLPSSKACPFLPRKQTSRKITLGANELEYRKDNWLGYNIRLRVNGVELPQSIKRHWQDVLYRAPINVQMARLTHFWIVDSENITAVFDQRNQKWCSGVYYKENKERNIPVYYWLYKNQQLIQMLQPQENGDVIRRGLNIQEMCSGHTS